MKTLIYGTAEYEAVKAEIVTNYGVTPTEQWDVKNAIRTRINDLKRTLRETGQKGYVLGISGGVDSSTVGKLCQLAVEELREEGYDAKFIAMRLPAGVQKDESDAQIALNFIKPDMTLTVNVGQAADIMSIQGVEELKKNGVNLTSSQEDFHKGNIKARLRMIAQYQICGLGYLCISTDSPCENIMGFFTKFGDGAADKMILSAEDPKTGVSKNQVRLMAKELGAPESVYVKVAVADLETIAPKTDSDAMGISSYDALSDFIEGKKIDSSDEEIIINTYNRTRHKRDATPMFRAK